MGSYRVEPERSRVPNTTVALEPSCQSVDVDEVAAGRSLLSFWDR